MNHVCHLVLGSRIARRRRLALVSVAVLPLAAPPAASATPPEEDWLSGARATGDWGGARSKLGENGLDIQLNYAGEAFVRGSDAAYRGNLDLLLELDTAKANLWHWGT